MPQLKIDLSEGLSFLENLPDNSVDLVLTDPPYITSRQTGMDKWVDHVDKQNAENAENIKTEKEWLAYKTNEEWSAWMDSGNVPIKRRESKLSELKNNFLKYGSIYGKKYAVRTDYGSWDSEFTMEKLNLFIQHFYRVLRPGGTCIIFFDIWKLSYLKEQLEEARFKQLRFIEWIKTNPQPLNSSRNYLTNCREIALLGVKKGKPTFNGNYDNAIYEFPIQGGKNRFHPTQKSLLLFEELIKKHSSENDTVLDCFLGSGTTAVASANLNRDFIGCEASEEYYEKSMDRLQNALQRKEEA